jgi:hypothetical protein
MIRLPRTLNRATRPAVALVLILAQAAGAFGFPILQTRHTVKACGCVMPCGADSANCCCAKPAPAPASKPRCPKCVDRGDSTPVSPEPQVKWVPGFKAKQCRGGDSPMGVLAELPSVPPAAGEAGRDHFVLLNSITIRDSILISHVSGLLDPPPRWA